MTEKAIKRNKTKKEENISQDKRLNKIKKSDFQKLEIGSKNAG